MRLRRLPGLLVVAALACACTQVGAAPDTPQRAVMVLFDISDSTAGATIRNRYLETFSRVLDFASQGGILAADVIDSNPLAHSTFPVIERFRPYDPLTENSLTHRAKVGRAETEAMDAAEGVTQHTDRGTDVFGGLELAARFFANYPLAEDRYLVVMSDMLQSSGRMRFGSRLFSRTPPTTLLARVRDRIPDLSGVKVYVVGAGAPAFGRIDASTIHKIEDFWLAYLRRTGADAAADRYGAALVRFP